MRHQDDVGRDVRQSAQPCQSMRKLVRREAQAIHAAVDLQPDVQQARITLRLEHVDLRRMMQRRTHIHLRQLRDILRRIEAAEQHDGLDEAGITQTLRLALRRHAEGFGMGQRAGGGLDAMTVGIGLEHGQHATVRSAALQQREVFGNRACIHARYNVTTHSIAPEYGCAV